jgi:hypothetical protein
LRMLVFPRYWFEVRTTVLQAFAPLSLDLSRVRYTGVNRFAELAADTRTILTRRMLLGRCDPRSRVTSNNQLISSSWTQAAVGGPTSTQRRPNAIVTRGSVHYTRPMRHLLYRLGCEDAGQDLIEYAFLAVFIAFAVMAGLQKEEQRRHRGCIAGRMPSQLSPRTAWAPPEPLADGVERTLKLWNLPSGAVPHNVASPKIILSSCRVDTGVRS